MQKGKMKMSKKYVIEIDNGEPRVLPYELAQADEVADAYQRGCRDGAAEERRRIAELIDKRRAEENWPEKWFPISERLPDVNNDGDSDYILLSFSNASLLCIGQYRVDGDGNGAFYDGDEDKSLTSYELLVNAWRPLPAPYTDDKRDG